MTNFLSVIPDLMKALMPQQAQAPALAPSTTTGVVQPCSLNPSHYLPCDVITLKMDHLPQTRADGIAESVSCFQAASRDPSLSQAFKDLLDGADLLLQVVADRKTGAVGEKESTLRHARIALSGELAPECTYGLHQSGTYVIQKEAKSGTFAASSSNPPISLLALPIDGVLDKLISLWPFGSGQHSSMWVELASCGVRGGSAAVGTLRGRVEIFPNDKIEIFLRIPPYSKQSQSSFEGIEASASYKAGASVAYVDRQSASEVSGITSRETITESSNHSVTANKNGVIVSDSASLDRSSNHLSLGSDGLTKSTTTSGTSANQSTTFTPTGTSFSNTTSSDSSTKSYGIGSDGATIRNMGSSVTDSHSTSVGKDGVTTSNTSSASMTDQSMGVGRNGLNIQNSSSGITANQSTDVARDGVSTTNSVSAQRTGQNLAVNRGGVGLYDTTADMNVSQTAAITRDGMALANTASGRTSSQYMGMNSDNIQMTATGKSIGAGQVYESLPDVGGVLMSMQAADDSSMILSVKRNGNELSFLHILYDILEQGRKLKETLAGIFAAKIQVGAGVSLDVIFMEGTLKGIWGALPKAAPENSRIWLVDRYFGVDTQLTILSVTGKGSFGVEVEVGKNYFGAIATVIAEAYVSLSITATLSASLKTIPEQERRFPAVLTSLLTVGVTGKAKLFGVGYDAEANVQTGAEGKIELVLAMSDPFRIEGTVGLKPLEVNIAVSGPFLKSYTKKYIWPEQDQMWKKDFHWPDT